MSRRGPGRLLAPLLLILALGADDRSASPGRDDSGDSGQEVYEGHYTFGFERSAFRPCESEEDWWVTRVPERVNRFVRRDTSFGGPDVALTLRAGTVYVRWGGEPSPRGEHGHLGAYAREFRVDTLHEARLPEESDCRDDEGRARPDPDLR